MEDALRLAAVHLQDRQVTAEVDARRSTRRRSRACCSRAPGSRTWLYTRRARASMADSDLLLPRDDWAEALALMEKLGFEDDLGPLEHPRMESGAGYPWVRRLRRRQRRPPLHALRDRSQPRRRSGRRSPTTAARESVGGVEVLCPPAPPGCSTSPSTQSSMAARAWEKPMPDLEMAVDQVPEETWVEAQRARRAARSRRHIRRPASDSSRGPRDRRLDRRRGSTSVGAALRLNGFRWPRDSRSSLKRRDFGANLAIVIRETFPNPAFMRWWSPLASRGTLGLVLAYSGGRSGSPTMPFPGSSPGAVLRAAKLARDLSPVQKSCEVPRVLFSADEHARAHSRRPPRSRARFPRSACRGARPCTDAADPVKPA